MRASTRARLPPVKGRSRRIPVSLAVLAVLVGLLTQGVAITWGKPAQARISYFAIAVPMYESVCVGDTVEFSVSISRHTTVNGQSYRGWVSGGYVLGVIANEQVGHFEPADAGRSVGPPPGHDAIYEFHADAPGTTDIEFHIRNTGEELRVGTGFPQQADTVTVEVTDCFDAYTSGLATIFTEKDMGDLTEPFFLEGRIATSTVAGSSQYMFFLPNPQNRMTGGYAFVDTAWALAKPGVRCTAYVSGRYDVVLYGDPAKPVEGDLLMKGSGVAVCPGDVIPIDYTSTPGFRIGFRPRAP